MKKITVERYQTYFGQECESAQECAREEMRESVRRLADRFGFSGMDSDSMASILLENDNLFRAVLNRDYFPVMTPDEITEHGERKDSSSGWSKEADKMAEVVLLGPYAGCSCTDPAVVALLPPELALENVINKIVRSLEDYIDNPSSWPTPGGFNQHVSDAISAAVKFCKGVAVRRMP